MTLPVILCLGLSPEWQTPTLTSLVRWNYTESLIFSLFRFGVFILLGGVKWWFLSSTHVKAKAERQQTFSSKDRIINIFGSEKCAVLMATTGVCGSTWKQPQAVCKWTVCKWTDLAWPGPSQPELQTQVVNRPWPSPCSSLKATDRHAIRAKVAGNMSHVGWVLDKN